MVACGLEVLKLDPCLFVGNNVICVCYFYDILFWSSNIAYINELAAKLWLVGFLGFRLLKNDKGLIEMKQTGLTDRVIEAFGLVTWM